MALPAVKIPEQCLHLAACRHCSGNNFPLIFNFSAEGCQAGGGTSEPPTERISPTSGETCQKSLLVWPALAICLVIKFKRAFYKTCPNHSLKKTVRICFQCCQPAVLALPRRLTAITHSATQLWLGKLLLFNEDWKKQKLRSSYAAPMEGVSIRNLMIF